MAQLPLPEYVVALGETELAAGRPAQAARDLDLMRAQQALLRTGGVNTDIEVALFEASHGDPERALAIARRGWAAAPSVRSADALGWALTRSGKPGRAWPGAGERSRSARATRCSSSTRASPRATPAGPTWHAAGWRARCADNPRFSPLWAPRARRALEGLG